MILARWASLGLPLATTSNGVRVNNTIGLELDHSGFSACGKWSTTNP
jgi:hypothetical protein